MISLISNINFIFHVVIMGFRLSLLKYLNVVFYSYIKERVKQL